jgi:hypothetical protein
MLFTFADSILIVRGFAVIKKKLSLQYSVRNRVMVIFLFLGKMRKKFLRQ